MRSPSGGRGWSVRGLLDVGRRRQEQVEKTLLYFLLGDLLNLGLALTAHHVDGAVDQVSHHRFDIAPDVADLRKLRGLDFYEWRADETRKPPRDLRLADARRTHEDYVVGRDLIANGIGRTLSAPPIPK